MEDRKDGGSQDKENGFEFEAIGSDSMNMFRQQALYLASSSFDSVCDSVRVGKSSTAPKGVLSWLYESARAGDRSQP